MEAHSIVHPISAAKVFREVEREDNSNGDCKEAQGSDLRMHAFVSAPSIDIFIP